MVKSCHLGRSSSSEKTHRPVQFEITEPTREAVLAWITSANETRNALERPTRQACVYFPIAASMASAE
jgi:hypothetical protein